MEYNEYIWYCYVCRWLNRLQYRGEVYSKARLEGWKATWEDGDGYYTYIPCVDIYSYIPELLIYLNFSVSGLCTYISREIGKDMMILPSSPYVGFSVLGIYIPLLELRASRTGKCRVCIISSPI